jgi:nucleoside-diphosphate-sugar epimerase
MNKVLVTGATGFLGSHVVRQLQAARLVVRSTGRSARADLPDYHSLNLLAPENLPLLMSGMKCVIHCAGLAHQFGRTDADAFFQTNVVATETLGRAAADAGVEHFVFISSSAVYGGCGGGPCFEDTPCVPHGAYAQSKYEAERRLTDLAEQSNVRLTIIRPATLYGPGDPGNVARLMQAIDRGRFLWVGSGDNYKTLMHRNDVARAVVLAAQRSGGPLVAIYNVAAPPVRMREVVQSLASALGTSVPGIGLSPRLICPPLKFAARIGPVRARAAHWLRTLDKWRRDDVIDGNKFFREFGFVPEIEFAQGIRQQVAWYRGRTVREPLQAAA